MNEPDISPLARRLAEENNVRWQELAGTGAGGKVVERDVLEYLARVMSGEEAVDPTPEPVPEGMEAWPDEDVAGYQIEAPSGQLSELQAELSAAERVLESPSLELEEPSSLVDQEDLLPAMAVSEQPDVDLQVDGEDITEDIFLFEDGDDQPEVEAEITTPAADLEDEGLLIAGDDEPISAPVPAESVVAEAETEGLDLGDLDPFSATDDIADDFVDDFAEEPESFEVVENDDELPDLFADDSVEMAAEVASSETEDVQPVLAEEDTETLYVDIPNDEYDEVEALEPELVDTLEANEVVGIAQAEEEGVVDETIPGVILTVVQDLPLVSYGNLLRRHLDLTALAAAQSAVSREIALEEPVPPTAFLVRAAAKALPEAALGDDAIAVARFDSGLTLQQLDDSDTMPFRELLEQLGGSDPDVVEADGLDLVVADMSSLDVDEAVLNLGVPVLTLGRILYDNQQGSYRSTLSLAGDVEPDQGARFLSLVAELLDSPVQLVL